MEEERTAAAEARGPDEAELERRVEAALAEAREAWREETERRVREAREEADALARMSGEERAEHERSQREAELDARERAVLRRELRADAAREMEARGLPPELVEMLDCESAERLERSVDVAERAFRAAVQKGVEARMRGGAPAAARRPHRAEQSDEDYYRDRLGAARRQR